MELKPGSKQTEVGVIPEDWEIKKVGDICGFIVPGRNKPRNFQGDIPWITTPDLEDGRDVSRSRIGLYISRDEAKNVGSKIVPAGSVLMSCAGELGIVAFTEREIVINQQLHAFIPSTIIDGRYLLNAIRAQKKHIDALATKTAVPYLNKDNCNSIPIAVPHLSEQRAIAAVLGDMDTLLDALDRLIAKKRDLKQAAMQQLLTGKTRLLGFDRSGGRYKQTEVGVFPKEWEVKPFGSVLSKGRLGGNYPNQDHETSYPLIKMGNIARGYIDTSKVEYILSGITPDPSDRLCYGDVLFNTRNTLELVGKVAIWRDELPAAYYNSNLMRLEFDPQEVYSNEYANCALNSAGGVARLRALATGTTSVAAIYTRDLLQMPFVVPPLPEQSAIATVLTDMDAEITALEQRREKTRALKLGMMQELLTGRTRLV